MKLLLTVSAVVVGAGLALCQSQPTIKTTRLHPTSAASGQDMYAQYCAVCHGTTGKGNGPAAAAMRKSPTDLTQLSATHGGKFPANEVAQAITGEANVGAHGTAQMPVWGELFRTSGSDAPEVRLRITNLTRYVETLQSK